MALIRLSSFLTPLFKGKRFHIQKIIDPGTTDGIEELGTEGYNEVRKLFDNKIIQSSDLTESQKIFYKLNPKANYTTGMMIDDKHGPKIQKKLTEIFKNYSTDTKLEEASTSDVLGTVRATLQTDSPAAALAKRQANKTGSFVIMGNRTSSADTPGEVYFSPKMLNKKFGKDKLGIDEFMTQQARLRRQGGTSAARRGDIIDEETGDLVKIYSGPELGKILGVSKKKYTSLLNNYYHKLGQTEISSKPIKVSSYKSGKIKEILDEQSDLDFEKIIKEYKEEVGLGGDVHLAHLLNKSPVTEYSSAQTLGTIGLMDKFSNTILYTPFDAAGKTIFNRQSALIKKIETGKFGKSNLNETKSELLKLNKQAKDLARDTNGAIVTREVIVNNIGVPGALKFRTIGKKQTPFSFKNRIEKIYSDNPLYDVPENQLEIVEQALPDLLIQVQGEAVQNIRNMAPILAKNKSLYNLIKNRAKKEGIELPKEFTDLEKKVGLFDLPSYEIPPTFNKGGRVGMDEGGMTFDEMIKDNMENHGMELKDAIEFTVREMYGDKAIYGQGGRVGMNEGGRVKLAAGGMSDKRKRSLESLTRNKVGTLESMLAGVGSGLIDIPKGAFTLGAALLDLGFGTSNAAKVERYFDDLTGLDEKAEATFMGNLTKIMVNLGVPGGIAAKKGAELTTKALLAKKNGNYFKLTDPRLQKKFKTSLNSKGRLFATLGAAGAAGVADMIFVGDPEHVGTIGDLVGGPTQLLENDENSAAREVINRLKFGADTSLLMGVVGGSGSAIKSIVRRRNELESNNDAIDKFLGAFRPRGMTSQEFFDLQRKNIGARAGDINYASQVSRSLDKHIDAIFPYAKNVFNKEGNKGRREFMAKLNDTLLSGGIDFDDATKQVRFGEMNAKKVNEITSMMKAKGGKPEDIQGVLDAFGDIRGGWGHMFTRLGGAMDDAAFAEFSSVFGNKFKDYLGATYDVFRNNSLIPLFNYKPSAEAVEKTVKVFREAAKAKGTPITKEEAEYYVGKVIDSARPARKIATRADETSGVYFNVPDFFVNNSTISDIEKIGVGRTTVPLDALTDSVKPVFDEVLGKIQDPMQTILTGTNKLSLVSRRNEFFQTLKNENASIGAARKAF